MQYPTRLFSALALTFVATSAFATEGAPGSAGLPSSQPEPGTAPTLIETIAMEQLSAVAAGWAGVEVESAMELFQVAAVGTTEVAADLAVQYGFFPDAAQLDDGTYPELGMGLVLATPSITQAQVDAYTTELAGQLEVSDYICWISWKSDSQGAFNSVAIVDADGIDFDTFASNMPAQYPPVAPYVPDADAGYMAQDDQIGPGWTWKVTNGFGVEAATMESSVKVQCLNGKVITCSSENSSSSTFLWEARVESSCKTIKNPDGSNTECCFCEISMGYASGFRSLEVGAGGVSLKVTGALGCAGAFDGQQMKCCGEAEPGEH